MDKDKKKTSSKKEEIELLTLDEEPIVVKNKNEEKKSDSNNKVKKEKETSNKKESNKKKTLKENNNPTKKTSIKKKKSSPKKTKEDKKKIKILIIAFCACFVILLGVLYTTAFQKVLVKSEVKRLEVLVSKNSDTKEIDSTLKRTVSTGKYKKAEIVYKKYIKDILAVREKINDIVNKDNLSYILSADNLKADGPKFVNTTAYLEHVKEELFQQFDRLIYLMSNEGALEYVKDEKLSPSVLAFYKKLSMTKDENMIDMKNSLIKSKDYYNEMLDTLYKAITFLKGNKNWKIEKNELIFSINKDFKKYNEIIKKLPSKAQ